MVKSLLKSDWKMNDILESPLYYLVEVLHEGKKEKKETSLISAFGG